MKFFDYIHFALKNLWRQKSRTFLTIFAIFIGAISVISMLALVLGAKNAFSQQLNASGALTQITVVANKDAKPEDIARGGGSGDSADGVKLNDALLAKVKAVPGVTKVSPTFYIYQLRNYYLKEDTAQKKHSFQNVQALEPDSAITIQLESGRNFSASDKESVIISDKNLEDIGYKNNPEGALGKTITFTPDAGYTGEGADLPPLPVSNQGNQGDYYKQVQSLQTKLEATIVGVTSPDDGNDSVYIPVVWARGVTTSRMYGVDQAEQDAYQEAQKSMKFGSNGQPIGTMPTPPVPKLITQSDLDRNGYQSFVAKTDDVNKVEPIAVQIRALGLGAATAKSFIDQQLKIFNLLGLVLGAIGAVSLLVAAIGVINTMIMATLERTREIGVMRACGATRSAVSRLFTFEAASLGFWGGMVGIGVGYILVAVANIFINRFMAAQHISLTNIISLPWWLAVGVVAATTIIGILAGLYPAVRAARLNPVDALRYE